MSETRDKTALPRPSTIGGREWQRRLAQRRKHSRELTALIVRLDGGAVQWPEAMDRRAS